MGSSTVYWLHSNVCLLCLVISITGKIKLANVQDHSSRHQTDDCRTFVDVILSTVKILVGFYQMLLLLLLLLLKIFKEGCPSATAAFQGALHLNTIHVLKNKFEKKMPNYNVYYLKAIYRYIKYYLQNY